MCKFREVIMITIMLSWFISPALAARDRGDRQMLRDRDSAYHAACKSVPEPSSLLLLAAGGLALYISRRSNNK